MTRTFVVRNTLKFSEEFWKDLFKIKDKLDGFEYAETLEEMEQYAFNEDHYEWVGNWLFDKKAQKLMKKHKVSGEFITDGEGDIYGILVEDGKLFRCDVDLTLTNAVLIED